MHFSASDNTFAINDKPSGHGQFPGVVAIESLQIDAETAVHFLELFREGEGQTEVTGNPIIFICQYRKGEFMLFHHLFRIFTQLWGNGDNGTSQFLHLAVDLLQSFQLYITIGSPDTSIKTDGKRAFYKKIL